MRTHRWLNDTCQLCGWTRILRGKSPQYYRRRAFSRNDRPPCAPIDETSVEFFGGEASGQCDYALVILKGLIEHNDLSAYFAACGALNFHFDTALQRGLVEGTFGNPRVSERGKLAYRVLGLDRLPQRRFSDGGTRAYMWDWSKIR